jgi:exodeoxyribonuclease V alpha subunit
VLQVALSGKAAQRLMQATQQVAFTIKSLLNKIQRNQQFLDGYEMPVLHIDEASMIDLPLMYQVLKVFEGRSVKLVMIGDEAQLPPIGPGVIFHSLIKFDAVQSVRLLGNYRQGDGSGVLDVANHIRNGAWPDIFPDDVVVVECNQDELLIHIQAIYCQHIRDNEDIYIVPPTNLLVAESNHQLHNYLRSEDPIIACAPEFKVGDPVIFKKNRPKIGLVNGSVGRVVQAMNHDVVKRDVRIETGKNRFKFVEQEFKSDLVIEFAQEGRVPLLLNDIKHEGERYLQHAYAITCHQAQGSEFDVVIVPIIPNRLLDRSWIYTALTRAKTKVYFLGNIAAAQYAVEIRGNSVDEREVGFRL